MGMLIDGSWSEDDSTKFIDGKFVRQRSSFRNWISTDGSSGFKGEAGRYTLYVTRSCPWAHRTLLYRGLKNLKDIVGCEILGRGDEGYIFEDGNHIVPGTDASVRYLHEIYSLADPEFTGRVTVPTLWDASERTIVNNESADIIRMFNSGFTEIAQSSPDYYPEQLSEQIDSLNNYIYENFNNGVYRAGFSTDQAEYEQAYEDVFLAMDRMEEILESQRYLCGNMITESDWRAFPTLTRFDNAYHYIFKCNKKHLYEYPNLWSYTRDLYQQPKVADLCYPEALKGGYWMIERVNPLGTIPKGPESVNFMQPHDRDKFDKS